MGYGSGAGVAFPPPLPSSPWCCSATEGLAPGSGQVSSPSARPWPRLRPPQRPVDAESAPGLCEPTPSSPPPPLGGGGALTPPIPNSVSCCAPPAAGASRGCPSWCREQQCRTPLCPRHDLHAGALCASHRVCIGRRCPTLFDTAEEGNWNKVPEEYTRVGVGNDNGALPRPCTGQHHAGTTLPPGNKSNSNAATALVGPCVGITPPPLPRQHHRAAPQPSVRGFRQGVQTSAPTGLAEMLGSRAWA